MLRKEEALRSWRVSSPFTLVQLVAAIVIGLACGYLLGTYAVRPLVPHAVKWGIEKLLPDDLPSGDLIYQFTNAQDWSLEDFACWHCGVGATALAIFTATSPVRVPTNFSSPPLLCCFYRSNILRGIMLVFSQSASSLVRGMHVTLRPSFGGLCHFSEVLCLASVLRC